MTNKHIGDDKNEASNNIHIDPTTAIIISGAPIFGNEKLPPTLQLQHLWQANDREEIERLRKISQVKPIDYWQPQPKQDLLIQACGLEDALHGGKAIAPLTDMIGMGGAVFGGKTEGLLAVGMIAGVKIPGVKVGYFRRMFPELEGSDGPIERSLALFPQVGGRYYEKKHLWQFGNVSDPKSGSLRFCHCQFEKDVFNYQSWAFDILLIDEAESFSWYILDFLLTRNRPSKYSQIPKTFCVMTANPGGVGHVAYMRNFGIKEDAHENEGEELIIRKCTNPNGEEVKSIFIPSFMKDNPIGMEKDPNYAVRMSQRDPKLRDSLLFGKWSTFAGQAFSEISKDHFCNDFEIPVGWTRWMGYDWGYDAPCSMHWYAQEPNTRRIYCYREFYQAKLVDSEQAKKMNDNTSKEEMRVMIFHWADPSLWRKQTIDFRAKSTADVFAENGIILTRADNNSYNKIRKVHQALALLPDGKPGTIFFNSCHHMKSTLTTLVTDPADREKILEGQEEHAYDDLAYSLTNYTDPNPIHHVTTDTPISRYNKLAGVKNL